MDNSPNELYSLWTNNKREFMSASKTSTNAVVKALRAICLFLGDGCIKDTDQASMLAESVCKELHRLGESGNDNAQGSLGFMYCYGVGVAKDEVKAVEWYGKSAQQGNPCAKCWIANYAKNQLDLGEKYAVGQEMPKDLGAAIQCYRRAAKLGQAQAQFNLGVMYANGCGVEKDEKLAVEWYRKAAEQEYAQAQYNLAGMYAGGRGVEKNTKLAVEWYHKAAGEGYAPAQCLIAAMYTKGCEVGKDDKLAVEWYRKAAEQGDVIAEFELGVMYECGKGVEKNEGRAAELYRKAAERGYSRAQFSLGVMYAQGRGVEKDETQAVKWYLKAATQGYASAQNNLGGMYAEGRGIIRDEKQAVAWYRKAAEQGDARAQKNFAVMLANGRGVGKDEKLAVEWFLKAAEQGNASAQTSLALMYEEGQGVAKDMKQALAWYRRAADKGFAPAQNYLGVMYETGLGVTKDKMIAAKWYRKASEQGDAMAQRNLERLSISYSSREQSTKLDLAEDADAIGTFAKERGITRLVHFTTTYNLISIIKLGEIMSRSALEMYKQSHPEDNLVNLVVWNDTERWDRRKGFINLSIEHINAPLFRKFSSQCSNQGGDDVSWCIIEIDPQCLRKKGVLFTMANASSSWIRQHGTASGAEGIKALYLESFSVPMSNGEVMSYSRSANIPRSWPTSIQAEVLFPGSIDLAYVKGVIFQEQDDKLASVAQYLFSEKRPKAPQLTFKVDPREFC